MAKAKTKKVAGALDLASVPGALAWQEELRHSAQHQARVFDNNYLAMAELLYKVYDGATPSGGLLFKAWGYRNFDEYVKTELGMDAKRAQRLRKIWFVLSTRLAQLSPVQKKRLVDLGFAKVRELIRVLVLQNCDEWLDYAETPGVSFKDIEMRVRLSLKEAQEREKAQAEAGAGAGAESSEVGPRVPSGEAPEYRRVVLFSEQAATFDAAIATARTVSGSARTGHNLALICADFLATNGLADRDDPLALVKYLAQLESHLGLRIVAFTRDGEELKFGADNLTFLSSRGQP